MKRYQITISGPNVQRCGFRKEAARVAREMGLSGEAAYVGKDILIEVEGTEEKLRSFMEWCKKGPEFCEISGTSENEVEVIGNRNFTVVHGVVNELSAVSLQQSA